MLHKICVRSIYEAAKWRPQPQERYAVISVIDVGAPTNALPRRTGFIRRLVIHADDVLPEDREVERCEQFRPLERRQAISIARFAIDVRSKADVLLIHCVAGMSRSPGVAVAIAEAFAIENLEISSQDAIPNRHVRKLVAEALAELMNQ